MILNHHDSKPQPQRPLLPHVLASSCEDGRYCLRALAPIQEGSELLISYRAEMCNRIYQVPHPLHPALVLCPCVSQYWWTYHKLGNVCKEAVVEK